MKLFRKIFAWFVPPIGMIALSACNPIIIGDSISNQTRPNFTNNPYGVAHPNGKVNASDGRGAYNGGYNGESGSGADAVWAEVGNVDSGGWMIVELGTNDIYFGMNPQTFRQFVADVVTTLPNDRCLGWVIPYDPARQTASAAFETVIREEITNQPCRGLIEWDEYVKANSSLVQSDGIHPTATGRQTLNTLTCNLIGKSPC